MRAIAILVLTAAALAAPLLAYRQAAIDLPTYTPEERWERASRLYTVSAAAGLAYAKSRGISPKEYGEFISKLMESSWGEPGSGSVNIIRGVRRNLLIWPEAEFEVTNSSETSVSARINRPWVKHFGEDKTLYGVSLDEYEEVSSVFNRGLAEYLGLQYEDEIEGDWLSMTFTQKK